MINPVQESQPSLDQNTDMATHQNTGNMVYTVKGGSILMVGRLVTYISRFGITFILARLLGAEKYGLYNLAISAATIAGAVSVFGLDTTLTRYIAIMNGRNDKAGLGGVIQVGLSTALLFSVLASTVLFGLAYPIAEHIFHEPRLAPLLQVASLCVPFLTLSDVLAGATRGFKKMADTVYAQNIAQPVIRLILIAVIAFTGVGLRLAIIIFGLADFCASIILLYFLHKRFNLRQLLTTGKRNTREILGFSLPLWLSDVLTTFRGNLQALLIGSLDSIRGVGIFSIANQVNLIGNIFHASMNQAARPLIAELNDQGKQKQVEHIYQTTTRWVVSLNIPIILILTLFPQTIMAIFGKSFIEGSTALAIIGFVNLVNVATGMCGTILEMTGHTRVKLVNSVIRVSVAVVANFLLIPRWGITGAAVAALIHEIVANSLPLVELWFMYRILPYNREFLKPLLAGMIAAGAELILRTQFPLTDRIIFTLLHMSAAISVYFIALRLLGFTTEERVMFKRLRRRMGGLLSRFA